MKLWVYSHTATERFDFCNLLGVIAAESQVDAYNLWKKYYGTELDVNEITELIVPVLPGVLHSLTDCV